MLIQHEVRLCSNLALQRMPQATDLISLTTLAASCTGVALGYSQMSDASVLQIPVHILQSTGILMVWAINAKYQRCLDMIGHWGYV